MNSLTLDLDSLRGWPGVILYVWLVSAILAAVVAPKSRRVEFVLITLMVLGPLGVGFAAVAQSRDPAVPGHHLYACPRCGARQLVPSSEVEFYCWRCAQHSLVRQGTLSRRRVESASRARPLAHTAKATATFAAAEAANAASAKKFDGPAFNGPDLHVPTDAPSGAGAGPSAANMAAAPLNAPATVPTDGDGPPLPWEAFPSTDSTGAGGR